MPAEAAGNTLQLIKYLRLHLIQDFMRSLFLWPRAVGRRLPEREERGKRHERPSLDSSQAHEGRPRRAFEAACAAEINVCEWKHAESDLFSLGTKQIPEVEF